MKLNQINRQLSKQLNKLHFSKPVKYVYNPLEYAREPCEKYFEQYASSKKDVIFLGMNPGPFGMAQTGVPFGEVSAVRDWLGIQGQVQQPAILHPKRPIDGFACKKSEVSGRRLWGWAAVRFGTAEIFFKRFFVLNYCPLVFMEESGKNFTPDKLPASEKKTLFKLCDAALAQIVTELSPRHLIGVGAFAQKRAEEACAGMPIKFGKILHPSPASPAANRGWARQIEEELTQQGVFIS
jgi:single-strand selective monofunctional uracil DNA glycosylase